MLLTGPALKEEFRGVRFDSICSQIDLSATLLRQLGISSSEFTWSKNIFNPYGKRFAYYTFTDGLGWVTPQGYFVYEHSMKEFYEKQLKAGEEEKIIRQGKSYLQVLFEEYLAY